jgi:hypothetical protein
MRSLLIHISLLHPLWHGSGDWPPSPFRLFQAVVAGAFGGRWAAEDQIAGASDRGHSSKNGDGTVTFGSPVRRRIRERAPPCRRGGAGRGDSDTAGVLPHTRRYCGRIRTVSLRRAFAPC